MEEEEQGGGRGKREGGGRRGKGVRGRRGKADRGRRRMKDEEEDGKGGEWGRGGEEHRRKALLRCSQ